MSYQHGHGLPPNQQDLMHKLKVGNYSLSEALQKVVRSLEIMSHRLAPDENMNVQNILSINSGLPLAQASYKTITLDDRFNGVLFSIYQGSCGLKLMGGSPPSPTTLTVAQFQQADLFAIASTGPVYVPLPMKKISQVSVYSDPSAGSPLIGSIVFVRF